MKFNKINLLFFVTIISFLVGSWVRFHYAFSTELWNDEAISYFIAKDTNWYDLFFSTGDYWDKVHPPTYYLFLKIMLFFSSQDWWLRLTSLMWFFPSAYLAFKIGELIKDKETGLLALSFFCLHPLLAGLSFQVRPYPMAIFLILISIFYLIKTLKEPIFKNSFLLGLFTGMSFLSIYSSALLILCLFIFTFILFLKRKTIIFRRFFLSLVISLIIILPQSFILLAYLRFKSIRSEIAGSVETTNLGWISKQLEMLLGNSELLLSLVIALVICLFLLIKKRNLTNQFLIASLLSTLFFSILFSYFLFPVFLARQLFYFSLILIFTFSQLSDNWRQLLLVFITLFILGKSSVKGENFMFEENVQKNIQQKINKDGMLLTLGGASYLQYYLDLQEKNVQVFLINSNYSRNGKLINWLLSIPSDNIFFVKERAGLTDINHYSYYQTINLMVDALCYKHKCEKISFLE